MRTRAAPSLRAPERTLPKQLQRAHRPTGPTPPRDLTRSPPAVVRFARGPPTRHPQKPTAGRPLIGSSGLNIFSSQVNFNPTYRRESNQSPEPFFSEPLGSDTTTAAAAAAATSTEKTSVTTTSCLH